MSHRARLSPARPVPAEILRTSAPFESRISNSTGRVLAVTSCDLFVPVLTFVFGEAQLEGNCAVVSTARLKEEFYGMPPREDLLRARLFK